MTWICMDKQKLAQEFQQRLHDFGLRDWEFLWYNTVREK